MDSTEIIGLVAAALITVANLPQLIKIIKKGSAKDISVGTYVLLIAGNGCWLAYGILKTDVPIIVGNSISTVLCSLILMYKLIGGKLNRDS